MKVTAFHHVSVNTHGRSLDDVVGFYRDLLGLEDEPRPEIPGVAGHWLAVGDQQLHLVAAPAAGAGIDPTGNHYCVLVDDLDVAVADLEARAIPYRRAVQGEGVVQIWFVDPAGNTVELQQDPR